MATSDPSNKNPTKAGDRYRRVFESAPIALFEEDFSAVWGWIDRQRAAGVADIRQHLESSPEAIREAVSLIEIVDVNPAAVELLGAPSRGDVLGSPKDPIVTEQSLPWFIEEIMALAEDRPKLHFDMTGHTFAGDERDFTVIWVLGPDRPAADSHVVVAVLDVTEQRGREKELLALMESKDALIASVSHELRTPLTAIMGFAQELGVGWDQFADWERREIIAQVGAQASELNDLVEDLLIAARLENHSLSVLVEVVDLAEVVRSTLDCQTTPNAQHLSVSLEESIALADPRRLRQIARNLLTNAVRHGGKQILVSTESSKDAACLVVRDDGSGLPPEHIETAFGRYVALSSARHSPRSIGLGLPISRHLAQAMGGNLTYNRQDGWTEFKLLLPRPPQDTTDQSNTTQTGNGGADPPSAAR